MSQPDPTHVWNRLAAAARTVPAARDATAPYGFSTRLAALAFAPERRTTSLLERFAFRAVAVAGVLAAVSVAVNYSALTGASSAPMSSDDVVLPSDDGVAAVLDLSD